MVIDDSRKPEWERQQRERGRAVEKAVTLQFGGGGGTSGPMDPSVSIKDYVDARDEAIETRLFAKLDSVPTKGTVWAAMGTAVGILLAVAAFAGDRFDGGLGMSSVMSQLEEKQQVTDKAQDAKLELMDQKLDILIKQTASDAKR